MHGRTVPSGSHVGTSFIEWTQMSTSSPRSATSSSFVKRPLPPALIRRSVVSLSPPVVKETISPVTAPFESRSRSAATAFACASASGDPRVPIFKVSFDEDTAVILPPACPDLALLK